jgi:peptidoglycan hydrolase-like protein with peptidoglycan-binding domain
VHNEIAEDAWDDRADDDARAATPARTRRGLRRGDIIGLAVLAVGSSAIILNALVMQSGPHPAPIGGAAVMIAAESKPAPTQAPAPKAAAAPKSSAADLTGSLTPPQPVARPASLAAAPAAAAPAAAEPEPRTRTQLVADVQRELQRLGVYDGALDGVSGPKTESAIRDIEQVLGWAESGEPSEKLLAALRRPDGKGTPAATRPAAAPTQLAATSQAPAATVPAAPQVDPRLQSVQRALARLGYGPIRPDGRPGSATRAAVQRFERDRNLPVTGEISSRLVRELAAVSGMPIE